MAENVRNTIVSVPEGKNNVGDDKGPPNSYLGSYYCRLILGQYERTKPFEPLEWDKPKKVLFLPLPDQLMDESPVGYSEKNLEGVGDLINFDLMTGAVGRTILAGTGPAIAGIAKAAMKVSGLGGKIGGMAAEVGGFTDAGNITSAIQQSVGLAPNPNPSVQFTGPVLRDFNFSWSFYPKTPEESENVDRMIKQLKASALPSNYIKNSTAILNYPDLCQINFFPWDQGGAKNGWGWTDDSIIRIKKCFIKNVKADYTQHGVPAFFHGTKLPVIYRLSLTLQETEYMLSNDWGGNTWNRPKDPVGFAKELVNLATQVAAVAQPSLFPSLSPTAASAILLAAIGTEGADGEQQ